MFQMTISSREDDMPPPFTDPKTLQDYYFVQQSASAVGQRRAAKTEAASASGGPGEEEGSAAGSPDRRLPTPDKLRILEMADSFGKHRLRKQQQLLSEIAQRCREQEVADLSSAITKKCKLSKYEDKANQRELTFYSTTSMVRKTPGPTAAASAEPGRESSASPDTSPKHSQRPAFERSRTFFPVRKTKQTPTKDYTLHSFPPRLQICYRKGVVPSAMYQQPNLSKTRKINGPIQLEHYQPRADQLAPLILPSVKYVGYASDQNNVESYVSTKKISLGSRSRTMLDTMSLPTTLSPTKARPGQGYNWTSMSQAGTDISAPSAPPNSTNRTKAPKPRLTQLILHPF